MLNPYRKIRQLEAELTYRPTRETAAELQKTIDSLRETLSLTRAKAEAVQDRARMLASDDNQRLADNARLLDELQRIKALRALLARVENRPPDPIIDAALATASDANPLWSAIASLLQAEYEQETQLALRPGLSGDDAQYYRGRAAGLFEFRAALLHRRAKAQGGAQ